MPIDAGPGGLFSARARNLDLLDAPGTGSGAFDDLIPKRSAEAPPADPLTPQQRASYERLREAADFEPETLTPEQWGILDRLEQRLSEPRPDTAPLRRAQTAEERAQLERDFGEGTADDLGVASRPGRPTEPAGAGAQPLPQPRAPQVRYEAVDRLPTASRTVRTAEDVAHLTASLRRDAQETVLAVVTDDAGQVLRVARIARGGVDQAAVDPRVAAGAVASTPGGRQAWFVHNHPVGGAAQSEADRVMVDHLAELLRGSGVDVQGMVTVAPGGRAAVQAPGGVERPVTIAPGLRREAVDVTERRLRGGGSEAPVREVDLPKVLPKEEGVMLLSGDGRPARWVPMSADEMRLLRQGEGGPSQRLLAAMDATNAQRLAARVTTPGMADAVAGNLRAFGRQLGASVDGVFDAAGSAVGRGADQATFYSNPLLAGAGDIARLVGLHPVRSALAGSAGGVAGATLSEGEPGSAQWWLDVATGAAVGAGGMAALRRLGVAGEGSFVDRLRVRTGTWANDWLFGNLDVREIKNQAELMRQVMDRQTAKVGKLLAERFTPEQRAKMADLIETRGIVADFNAVHAQAAALDEYLTAAGERMKALGLLPPDVETGGYLHRYYAKHLGLDGAFREAKAQSLSGSYSQARGTESAFGQEYLSPGARAVADELAQVQRDMAKLDPRTSDLLGEDTAARLDELKARRRELRKTEFVEYIGEQNGKPQSFFFVRNEVPRVPGADGDAVLAQLNRPRPGELARPADLPDVGGPKDLSPT
ncbi:MAG TPA: JAB domain-containing protein, partial [Immundisolibacter sp.]|nr:JAB domain-containing protein [Immundisolibacter sp.]